MRNRSRTWSALLGILAVVVLAVGLPANDESTSSDASPGEGYVIGTTRLVPAEEPEKAPTRPEPRILDELRELNRKIAELKDSIRTGGIQPTTANEILSIMSGVNDAFLLFPNVVGSSMIHMLVSLEMINLLLDGALDEMTFGDRQVAYRKLASAKTFVDALKLGACQTGATFSWIALHGLAEALLEMQVESSATEEFVDQYEIAEASKIVFMQAWSVLGQTGEWWYERYCRFYEHLRTALKYASAGDSASNADAVRSHLVQVELVKAELENAVRASNAREG